MLDFSELKLTDRSPIYLQLIQYIKAAIVGGNVQNGEEMPSRRLLSSLLGVNPNTVQKAYRIMEEEGLIVSHAGSGSVVTFTPQTAEKLRRQLMLQDTKIYLSSLKAMGLTLQEAVSPLEEVWTEEKEEDR